MKLGRPKKKRFIQHEPVVTQFSPRGRRGRPDYVELDGDEFEAIRLADYKCSNQTESARSMGVSQQTFSRILKKARKCVSEALVHGKIIRITKSARTIDKTA